MASSISKAESAYICSGIRDQGQRADGRGLLDYRTLHLETGVSPLANGSARLAIGAQVDGSGGTEVLAATKLEVEEVTPEGGSEGKVACTVICTPSAYPHLSSSAMEDLQSDLTALVSQTLAHPSLTPKNLGIIPGRKAWLMHVDAVVMADSGNVLDAIFMAIRAAVWDTKVPRTRSVAYTSRKEGKKSMDSMAVDCDPTAGSGFDTRKIERASDFELPDYWDEGEPLEGRHAWPICVTLNVIDSAHFLDATLEEELSVPLRTVLLYTFSNNDPADEPDMQAMRTIGTAEMHLDDIKQLILHGQKYSRDLLVGLNAKLEEEDIRRTQKARDRFEATR